MSAQLEQRWYCRSMVIADLGQVVTIERASYEFPWSEGIFRDCIRVGYKCRVVTGGDNTILGYGLLSTAVDEAHILNLCVHPDHRRTGLGSFILEHLIQRARLARAEAIMLEVRPSNPAAIGMYESRGFRKIGKRKRYYPAANGREDAVLYAKQL